MGTNQDIALQVLELRQGQRVIGDGWPYSGRRARSRRQELTKKPTADGRHGGHGALLPLAGQTLHTRRRQRRETPSAWTKIEPGSLYDTNSYRSVQRDA